MTVVTNVHGLPEALVPAVTNDPYVGGGDISVTKLIDAPQVRALTRKHHDKLVVDVSERIWALLGQGVHTVLERAALRFDICRSMLRAIDCSTSDTETSPSLSTIGDRRSAQNLLPMRGELRVTPFSATAPPVART